MPGLGVCPMRHIRGVIASASLKPLTLTLGCVINATYPRRYRLGLIEAYPQFSTRNTETLYPRRYRLGLIEACTHGFRNMRTDYPYPRRYRLGLIEAW